MEDLPIIAAFDLLQPHDGLEILLFFPGKFLGSLLKEVRVGVPHLPDGLLEQLVLVELFQPTAEGRHRILVMNFVSGFGWAVLLVCQDAAVVYPQQSC
jgi:hypothetical protein